MSDVRVTIPAGSPAAPVAVPLVLGLAGRAGLPVERVDELGMAAEMLLGQRAPADVELTLEQSGGTLTIVIRGLPTDRVDRQRTLLATLVDDLDVQEEKVVLRAGG